MAVASTMHRWTNSTFWNTNYPQKKQPQEPPCYWGHQVKDKQLKPQQDPFAIQRIPGFFFFFSMKALRKHLVVDIGLTIRTESVSLGLSCRQDIFIVTVFHTGKSEAGGISVVK